VLQPGPRLESLERRPRPGEERSGLVAAAVSDEVLRTLELRRRDVERTLELAEEPLGGLELSGRVRRGSEG
jgi:hypothetical protein